MLSSVNPSFYKKIVETAPVAIYVNNIKTHSIEYVNQFGLDLVGFSQEDLAIKGLNWQSERLHPDDSEFVNEQIKCILRGESFSETFIYRLKNNEGVYETLLGIVSIAEFDKSGKPLRLIGVNIHLGNLCCNGLEVALEELLRQSKRNRCNLQICKLTCREKEVIHLIAQGKRDLAIGEALKISPNTAETHRKRIIRKLGLKSTPELVRFAIDCGLD